MNFRLIVAALVVVGFGLLAFAIRLRRQRRDDQWRQLALRLSGRVIPTASLGPSAVSVMKAIRFSTRSQFGLLLLHRAGALWNRRWWLEIRLPWRADSFACFIRTSHFAQHDRPEPWPRSRPAETLLGPGWEVRTRESDEPVTLDFCRSERVQQTLGKLLQADVSGRLLVRFDPRGLTITKPIGHRSIAAMFELVSLADEFFDAAVLGDTSGIEIAASSVGCESAACPVCGETVEAEERVLCRRCLTPHHRDCWDFNHQCAIYGCNSNERTEDRG